MYNFDQYNVFLAIATNKPQRLEFIGKKQCILSFTLKTQNSLYDTLRMMFFFV